VVPKYEFWDVRPSKPCRHPTKLARVLRCEPKPPHTHTQPTESARARTSNMTSNQLSTRQQRGRQARIYLQGYTKDILAPSHTQLVANHTLCLYASSPLASYPATRP